MAVEQFATCEFLSLDLNSSILPQCSLFTERSLLRDLGQSFILPGMRAKILRTLVVLFVLVVPAAAADDSSLPFVSPIFGDGMVLQRGKPNPIWGWAKPGQAVQVEIAGRTAKTVAEAGGRWQVGIEQPAPGGPYTIKIVDRKSVV